MSSLIRKINSKNLVLSQNFLNINLPKNIHVTAFNMIKLSEALSAEPTKAKKRVDPALIATRETRKRKRIEKEIKKLEKLGRILKPIEETKADRSLIKEQKNRQRSQVELSKEEIDDEYFLKKEWKKYIAQQQDLQMEQIQRALKSQESALKELKKDNMNLYLMAIQLDQTMLPYVKEGPVYTTKNESYEPPEGDYEDVTYLYDKK